MEQSSSHFVEHTAHAEQKSFQELLALGLFSAQSTGIQIDLNVAYGKDNVGREGHLCDHNCTLQSPSNPHGGGYACPAAYTLIENRRLDSKTLASFEDVMKGIGTTTAGLQFIQSLYFERLQVLGYPPEITDGIAAISPLPEINLFGGNPEMHPHIHEIIESLTTSGYSVTLTTTGKRFLTSPEFVRKLLAYPPTKIALSADDLPTDTREIARLGSLSQEELRAEFKRIPPTAGQKQKAIEAINVLRLAQDTSNFPPIILNFVLHAGNIEKAEAIMQMLGQLYPGIELNPYPAQSAFSGETPLFTAAQLKTIEHIVDRVIAKHFSQTHEAVDFRVVPRLYYYLLVKSVFLAFGDTPQRVNEVLSGYGLWRCYEDPVLTGRYIQIGGGKTHTLASTGQKRSPGGHPGCFWNNETVTSLITVWDASSQQVRRHIVADMRELAATAEHPCPGCGFPRLVFDDPSALAGIPHEAEFDKVREAYLTLRRQFAGF